MPGPITISVSMFFDPTRILAEAKKANSKNLVRAGAFVRKRAQTSIRQRKGTSAPGQPPSSHTGELRRFIYFGLVPATQTVVVGPALTRMAGTVPNALEHGGTVTLYDFAWSKDGRFFQKGSRLYRMAMRNHSSLVTKRVTIAARPFMQPAMEKEAPNFPGLWANSVK